MFRFILFLLVVFVIFWGITTYLIKKKKGDTLTYEPRVLNQQQKEKIILNLAKRNNNLITTLDVAANSDLSVADADEILREWVKTGYADLKISESGKMIYQIAFFDDKDRNNLDNLMIL